MPNRHDIDETPKSAKWKLSLQGKSAVFADLVAQTMEQGRFRQYLAPESF